MLHRYTADLRLNLPSNTHAGQARESGRYQLEETGVTISGIPFDLFGSERITGRCKPFGGLPISLPGIARSNSKALTSVNNKALILFTKRKDL